MNQNCWPLDTVALISQWNVENSTDLSAGIIFWQSLYVTDEMFTITTILVQELNVYR